MKKILFLAGIFLLSASAAYALARTRVSRESSTDCGPISQMAKVMDDFDEEVVFAGLTADDTNSNLFPATIITLNKQTGTWSRFMLPDSQHVCLLVIGVGGKTVSSPHRKNTI